MSKKLPLYLLPLFYVSILLLFFYPHLGFSNTYYYVKNNLQAGCGGNLYIMIPSDSVNFYAEKSICPSKSHHISTEDSAIAAPKSINLNTGCDLNSDSSPGQINFDFTVQILDTDAKTVLATCPIVINQTVYISVPKWGDPIGIPSLRPPQSSTVLCGSSAKYPNTVFKASWHPKRYGTSYFHINADCE